MESQGKTLSPNLRPWKKGDPSPNPSGRPKGQRNYATIYRSALEKLGAANDMTPEELEDLMEQSGLMKAIMGDVQFQKDIKDRLHGKPTQGVELTGKDGKPIDASLTVTFVKP